VEIYFRNDVMMTYESDWPLRAANEAAAGKMSVPVREAAGQPSCSRLVSTGLWSRQFGGGSCKSRVVVTIDSAPINRIPISVVDSELHEFSIYDNLVTTARNKSVVRVKASDARISHR
jgi:hypothetical protein